MKNKIEKLEVFRVDNCQFNTEAEAVEYINQRDNEQTSYASNLALLDSLNQTYIPVMPDTEHHTIDIFIKSPDSNGGNYDVWKTLVDGKELRYYPDPLHVIEPDHFIQELCENPSISIDSNDFQSFVLGVISINDLCVRSKLDWKTLLIAVSNITISPVHIYDQQ